MSDYAVFIITNGRPDGVLTDRSLRRQGYSGRIYYIIDNEDKDEDKYKERYGDLVKVFDKKKYADSVDEGDNFDNRRTTTHARNACFDIAADLGIENFIVLDDDYTQFIFRTNASGQYPSTRWTFQHTLGDAFRLVFLFMESTDAKSVCIAQGGDFIGGSECSFARNPVLSRKVMNSFFCMASRRFHFRSRLNEDVNTYLSLGFAGELFLTIPLLALNQKPTQLSSGGMSESYIEHGTYVKSFYSVMYAPHSVKISMMGQTNRRVHHWVNWRTAVPKIVSESQRKTTA